jgi:multisubunit Na+/H+ antiporter MnhF subunit
MFEPYPFFRAFAKSLGHRVLSGDTLNLPWLATWLYQGFNQGVAGLTGQVASIPSAPLWLRLPFKLVFGWQFLVLLYRYVNGQACAERTLAYSLVGFLAYVTLSSGVHENHWFLPSFLAIALLQYGHRWLRPAAAVGIVANLNLLLFYGITGHGLEFTRVVGIDVTVGLAAAVVAVYFWMARVVRRMDQTGWETAAR